MNRIVQLRKELARRALADLEALAVDVLREHPDGLKPNQLAEHLGILPPSGDDLFDTDYRSSIGWAVLHGPRRQGLVEKRGSRAVFLG